MICPTCGREEAKSHDQRKLFHALCFKIGTKLGMEPGMVKEAIKTDFFGIDEFRIGNKWYRRVKSSEDAGKTEYSALIDYAYRWAAEQGVYIE